MTLRGYKINTISHSDATRESLTGNHQARKSKKQTTKTCQVQLHTILLTIGLIAIGWAAFIGLQFRGSNPTSKSLFQPTLADAED